MNQPTKAAQLPRIYTDASVFPVGGIKRIGGHWSIYGADSWPDEYISLEEHDAIVKELKEKAWKYDDLNK